MNRTSVILAGVILGAILAPDAVDAALTKETWPRESTAPPLLPPAPRGDCITSEYHYHLFGVDPFDVPDDAAGISFSLPTGGCGINEDVVVGFNMTHTWVGDLYVRLGYDMDNDGTDDVESTVLCRPGVDDCSFDAPPYGCDGDLDGSYTFSTHGFGTLGETTLGTCASTFPSGCYLPDPFFADLSVFNGLPRGGTYSLFVQDNAAGDTGTISWFRVYVLASEDVIHVPGNVPTVQMAIDVACDGAEIVIGPGTYPEHIVHSYPSLTIRAEDPANRPVLWSFTSDDSNLSSLALSDLEFTEGVSIGAVAPSSGVSISNCAAGGSIYLSAASANVTVDGTIVSGGLSAMTTGLGDVLITNVQAASIDVVSGHEAIVSGSQTSGDITLQATGVDVGVGGCRAARILMDVASGFSIQNVTGIVSMDLAGGECVLLANTIVDQNDPVYPAGASLTGYGSATVSRNIVDGFEVGLRLRGGVVDGLSCNDVSNCDVPWDIDSVPDPTGTDGNFSADPLFCDRAAGDYRLSEDSPCLPGNHPDGYACGGTIGAITETCAPSAVDPGDPTLGPWGLVTAMPNPARTQVTLSWNLPGSEETRLDVVSVDGRRVWSGTFPGGAGSSVWDLRGADGQPITPGAYFVRATSGRSSTAARLLLLR